MLVLPGTNVSAHALNERWTATLVADSIEIIRELLVKIVRDRPRQESEEKDCD
jgi:hypothetical protein